MNPIILFLAVMLASTLAIAGEVRGDIFPNTCQGGLSWMNSVIENLTQDTQTTSQEFLYSTWNTTFGNRSDWHGWGPTKSFNLQGENFTIYIDSQVGYAANFTFNFTASGDNFRSIISWAAGGLTKEFSNLNVTNYTGFGFWLKGNDVAAASGVDMEEIKHL